MTFDQIVILASAVIQDKNNKILFLKRSNKSKTFQSYWQLPEGRIEANESPKEALVRELKEEIGSKPTNINLKHLLTIPTEVKGVSYLLIKAVFMARCGKLIQISDDHTGYRWFSKERAMNSLSLVPGTKEILQKV